MSDQQIGNGQQDGNGPQAGNVEGAEQTGLAKVQPAGPSDVVLGEDKQAALELLKLGNSVAETARSTGVTRTTLYRWLKSDPHFAAAFNQWQNELEESSRARLMMLTEKATKALERALDHGDARAAVQLLRGMGVMKAADGPRATNVEEVSRRQSLEKKERRYKLEAEERKIESERKKDKAFDRMFGDLDAKKDSNGKVNRKFLHSSTNGGMGKGR